VIRRDFFKMLIAATAGLATSWDEVHQKHTDRVTVETP
jgi:hypothetical protein